MRKTLATKEPQVCLQKRAGKLIHCVSEGICYWWYRLPDPYMWRSETGWRAHAKCVWPAKSPGVQTQEPFTSFTPFTVSNLLSCKIQCSYKHHWHLLVASARLPSCMPMSSEKHLICHCGATCVNCTYFKRVCTF